MKAIIKNPKRFFELLRLYFVPVKGRKVVHVPAYAYKEDENEKIYLHNNDLHLSKKMFEFLVKQGVDLVECPADE
ncbi:MAG: hypothetical protein E6693_02690 [Streptococcus mitis]|jgi:hypothetical protein|uniref:Uncharacterized protein n=1 Tax=Streptococcus mitis TaxID=28037 RepID=A0A428BI32_STRMT|nr:hypothetical protein [Streptococcus mitis]MDU3188683.1 hypothetical protein [Streptococcus mitis]RSI63003.1 hypothetical protein D8865_03495 [Streptococcus mitis]